MLELGFHNSDHHITGTIALNLNKNVFNDFMFLFCLTKLNLSLSNCD